MKLDALLKNKTEITGGGERRGLSPPANQSQKQGEPQGH